jgi:hypothetical protein
MYIIHGPSRYATGSWQFRPVFGGQNELVCAREVVVPEGPVTEQVRG